MEKGSPISDFSDISANNYDKTPRTPVTPKTPNYDFVKFNYASSDIKVSREKMTEDYLSMSSKARYRNTSYHKVKDT